MLISKLELQLPASASEDPCIFLNDLKSEPSSDVEASSANIEALVPAATMIVSCDDNLVQIVPAEQMPQPQTLKSNSTTKTPLADPLDDKAAINDTQLIPAVKNARKLGTVEQPFARNVLSEEAESKELFHEDIPEDKSGTSRLERNVNTLIHDFATEIPEIEGGFSDLSATPVERIVSIDLQESHEDRAIDAQFVEEQPTEASAVDSDLQSSHDDEPSVSVAMECAAENILSTEVDMCEFELSDFEYLPEVGRYQPENQLSGRLPSSIEALSLENGEETEEDFVASVVVEDDKPSELEMPNITFTQVTEAQAEEASSMGTTVPDGSRTPRPFPVKAEHPMDLSQFQQLDKTNSVTEARVLGYIHAIMEMFATSFEAAQQTDTSARASSLALFTAEQLQKSLLHYGINHVEFGLNGVFLALGDDLGIHAELLRSPTDAVLKKYLLMLLPPHERGSAGTYIAGDQSDLAWLFQVESALNVLSDMRSWHEPTRIRVSCIEKHSTNTFLLPSASDSKASPTLRLSDKDRDLLSGVHANEHVLSTFDVWISDGLEILYLFLYTFLNSHRNTGSNSITKLNFCRTRVERVQATVQKVISLDPTTWRKMEFLFSEIEDFSMAARIKELMGSFLTNQKTHMKALESCLFVTALVAFISRKAEHISQSIAEFIKRENQLLQQNLETPLTPSAQAAVSSQSALALPQRCANLFREQLEGAKLDASSHFEGYLRNVGLKTIDMDKINKSRSARNLSRVNLSGKYSLGTQHQCELMGSDFALHLRPQWNQDRLKAAQVNRYFFHGEASVAMEAVYVRRKVDLAELEGKTWEDTQHYVEDDIREAFRLLSSGVPSKSGTLLVAIGVNALHLDLLEVNSSFNAMVMENPKTQSLSMGYFVSKEPDIAAIRVVFRVHVDTELLLQQQQVRSSAIDDGLTASVTNCAKLFLGASKNDEDILIHALETNYLRFLFSCLDDPREQHWRDIAFGGDFLDHLRCAKTGVQYPREAVLDCMSALIEWIPKSLVAVTKRNLDIVIRLVVLLARGNTTTAGTRLVDTAMKALKMLCRSQANQPAGVSKIEPFIDYQRKFAAEDGLKFLIDAADLMAATSPSRQLMFEEMILTLMKSAELCSSKPALLVHWRHWMAYYVENGACASTRTNREFLPMLLEEIHMLFFSQSAGDWDTSKATMVSCGCGCKASAPESLKSAVGVMKLFLALLLKEKGVLWGQDGMKGPLDCLKFFSWTLSAEAVSIPTSFRPLQLSIFEALCSFLDRMTSGDRLLHFLSDLTPKLLELLLTLRDSVLQRAVLRTLSLALELALEKAVWKNSVQAFLDSLYLIIQTFCPAESAASTMNALMVETLFHHDHAQTWQATNHEGDSAEELRRLLHEEHVEVQQARAHQSASSSRGRSLLESLLVLMMLPSESPLQLFCQGPLLIGLGWLLNSAALAEDCAALGLNVKLQELLEDEHTPTCILAARIFCVLHFQLMTTATRAFSDNALKRLGNALTITMGTGARMSLLHQDTSGSSEQFCFSADQHDSFLILERFIEVNSKKKANIHVEYRSSGEDTSTATTNITSSFQEQIWENHEWEDPERAMTAKLGAFINLLAVFSCMTSSVRRMKHSEELKQIQQLLWVSPL